MLFYIVESLLNISYPVIIAYKHNFIEVILISLNLISVYSVFSIYLKYIEYKHTNEPLITQNDIIFIIHTNYIDNISY